MAKNFLMLIAFFFTVAAYAQTDSYDYFVEHIREEGYRDTPGLRTWIGNGPAAEGNDHLSPDQHGFLTYQFGGNTSWIFVEGINFGNAFTHQRGDELTIMGKYDLHGGTAGNFVDFEFEDAAAAKDVWLYANYKITFPEIPGKKKGTIMWAQAFTTNPQTLEDEYLFVIEFELKPN